MPANRTIGGSPWVVSSPRARGSPAAPTPLTLDWRRPLVSAAQPLAWSPRTGTVSALGPDQKILSQTVLMFALTGAVMLLGALLGDRLVGIGNWAYVAVGVAELLDAAVPFVPTPAHAFTYSVAASWSPLLVAMVATVGSTLGETVGYLAGQNGQRAIQQSRLFRSIFALLGGWQSWLIIALAVVPIPVYLAGVYAGAFSVSYKRFVLYAACGKLALFGTMAFMAWLS
ncbi:MAG: putative rane protein [Dehalococcoidia bacterium]|nr:putative rane protein [Dehalococcoidia bacterium]